MTSPRVKVMKDRTNGRIRNLDDVNRDDELLDATVNADMVT